MENIISAWQPWRVIGRKSLLDRVDQAKQANASLCLKVADGTGGFGLERFAMFQAPPYRGFSNDDLERLAKVHGVPVDIWVVPYLVSPEAEARVIRDMVARFNPRHIFIDAEQFRSKGWKSHAHNTGAFLRSLGRLPGKVWLQSYRRPDLHRELQWQKILTYQADGQYIFDGLSPQAYPIQSQLFAQDYGRMLNAYRPFLANAGRPDIPWLVTMPAFSEWGWTPTAKAMQEGVDFLVAQLGDKLQGFNWWRQSFLFQDNFKGIYEIVKSIQPAPAPIQVGDTVKLKNPVSIPAGAEYIVDAITPTHLKLGVYFNRSDIA